MTLEEMSIKLNDLQSDLNDAFDRISELEAESLDYSARLNDLEIDVGLKEEVKNI